VGLAARHAGLDPKNLSTKAARYGLRKGAGPAAAEERDDPDGVDARPAKSRPRLNAERVP
jgi:hypothetical protein